MKLSNYIKLFAASTLVVSAMSSCNDFLSTLPDSRAEVDSYEDIRSLLISAYPDRGYGMVAELSTDNVVHNVEASAYTTRFYDQIYAWDNVTETANESPKRVWESAYSAIQTANAALEAIDKKGNTAELKPLRGEALICRAYGHFLLANLFAEPYAEATATTTLGVPYMTKPETTLNPKYTRETLASNFERIAADIEEGLPLIGDQVYSVPKYHFNKKAANAFAARFYLFYQKWDKAYAYAQAVLGSSPANQLRDYAQLVALPSGQGGFNNRAIEWVDHTNTNNLLLLTDVSSQGRYFGFFTIGSGYTHSGFVADRETVAAPNAWGSTAMKVMPERLTDPYRKVILPKNPLQIEYTDRVAGTGYLRTTYADFTTDETLLVRAEASIMLGKYTEALADMNLYLSNTYSRYNELTAETIKAWNESTAYHTSATPTPRKRLNASWTISAEQENYLQVLLHMRRIETIQTGLRWFDIKRYGIEVARVDVTGDITPRETGNTLTKDDKRRAFQIPEESIAAGMTPNRQ